jgi:hypothetical protein
MTSTPRRKQRLLGDLAQGNRRHGLSPDLIAGMVVQQQGLCAICLRPLPVIPLVDHDHALEVLHGHPGRGCPRCVRGLLDDCNLMLGFAQDRPEVLEAGARYLRAWYAKQHESQQRRTRT